MLGERRPPPPAGLSQVSSTSRPFAQNRHHPTLRATITTTMPPESHATRAWEAPLRGGFPEETPNAGITVRLVRLLRCPGRR